jgi:hypothetical protein
MNQRLHIISAAVGAMAALLLARLVLQLLAARPDNPIFAAVRAVTAPLIVPLAALDAGQPRFGAVLEWSTLALLLLMIVIIGGLAGALHVRRSRAHQE